MVENENFLERWSRRKRDDEQTLPQEQPAEEQQAALEKDQSIDQDSETQPTGDPAEGAAEPHEPAAWESVDIETLNAESDYTVFMAEGVPDNVKKEALDKLWRSDPVLANLDGLNDYDDDYSKWGIVSQVVKTAYKVGQGYMTDDEVAQQQVLRDEEDRIAAERRGDEVQPEDSQPEDTQSDDDRSDVVAQEQGEPTSETSDGDEQPIKQAGAEGAKPEIIDDEPDEVV